MVVLSVTVTGYDVIKVVTEVKVLVSIRVVGTRSVVVRVLVKVVGTVVAWTIVVGIVLKIVSVVLVVSHLVVVLTSHVAG